ncbi:MAG: trypsin-like peptidase domain-containing protein [Chloroflexota bacterium]|nr:trypsin-like peptidase domain-containing protein [Chloroflexota bacterium]
MSKRTLVSLLIVLVSLGLAACELTGGTREARKVQPTTAPTSVPQTSQSGAQPQVSRSDQTSVPTSGPVAATQQPVSQTLPVTSGGPGMLTVPQVVKSVRPAVVQVITQTAAGGGTGSGFIIDKQSHIITNNHVVEGAQRVTVVLDNNRVARARVIGTDPLTDIAVVQIPERNLPTVPLGDATKLQVGETVVAIGSALGLPGGPTVTTGVVSALNRSETEPGEDPNGRDAVTLYDLIQTDTAINPGNSGGPLLNLRGEVIGINTLGQRATASGVPVQGINYAVSVNTAKAVSAEIIRSGQVVYPYMGVNATFLYPQRAIAQGLPDIPGQFVVDVLPGAPADDAGLRRGDVITAINGQRITDESTFIRVLRGYKPGDRIRLTVVRNGKSRQFELRLARREEP